jgi:hypothetical protein
MTHQQPGHAATAREFLDKARKSYAEFKRDETTTSAWPQRVEPEKVRREAEEFIGEGKKP